MIVHLTSSEAALIALALDRYSVRLHTERYPFLEALYASARDRLDAAGHIDQDTYAAAGRAVRP